MALPHAPNHRFAIYSRGGFNCGGRSCLWFKRTKTADKEFKITGSDGCLLIDAPDCGFLRARYYEIGTDRFIFGDRDLTIHDDVDEISRERRDEHAWFTDKSRRVIERFAYGTSALRDR